MTKIKPLYYQVDSVRETIEKLKNVNSLVVQGMTGSGKTYIGSFVIQDFLKKEPNKKILIAVHKEELLYQFQETLITLGITCEIITSSKKKFHHTNDVYIAMQKTIENRIKENPDFLKPLSLIVVDEAHYLGYLNLFSKFPEIKKIGLTATPILLNTDTYYKCEICNTKDEVNKICCGVETMEWTKPRTMSQYFDDIVVGPKPSTLIEVGQIVKEFPIRIDIDTSKLSTDSSGEYTAKSIKETFGNEKVMYNVLANYEVYCKNKKTIIFNPNTEVNQQIYEQFKDKGYNVRLFDSVNKREANKKETLEWFKNTPDAIILNVGAFIAGTDVRDIQAVILNYATMSLSKYLQSGARGGRSCSWIFKEDFIFIDMGNNIRTHGLLTDDSRDWVKLFYKGLGKEKAKQENIESVVVCSNCDALTSRSQLECVVCGHERKQPVKKEATLSDEIAQPLELPKPPSSEKIIEFTKRQNQNSNFAVKIFISQVKDLFIFHQVTQEKYERTKTNGKLEERLIKMARPFYFALIRSDLPQGKNMKLNTFIKKVSDKVASLYN